jgi:hypothetical protein
MVSVEVPPPVIVGGLNPQLETPAGNPFWLSAVRLTVPLNPFTGVTVTLNVAFWPGMTVFDVGVIVIEKSPLAGSTVMIRAGGLGSLLPLASITVIETEYVPGVLKTTLPGFCTVEVPGEPPGNTHE